jgi:hypothetical protein
MVQIWLGNAGLWLGIFHGMNGWESLRTVHTQPGYVNSLRTGSHGPVEIVDLPN